MTHVNPLIPFNGAFLNDAEAVIAWRVFEPRPLRPVEPRAGSGVTITLDALGAIISATAGTPDDAQILSAGQVFGKRAAAGSLPGTLTVSTANVAADPHTHAITSSSNPGVAASLLATNALGALTTQVLKAADTTEATTKDTGCVILEGGLGVEKSAFLGQNLTVLGQAGIGDTYDSGNRLLVKDNLTLTAGSPSTLFVSMEANPSGNSSASYIGNTNGLVTAGSFNFTGSLVAVSGLITHDGSGTISSAKALQAGIQNTTTGVFTLARGLHILSATNTGGGSIGTNIGLEIAAQTAGGTNYAILTGAGQVSLGDTTDSSSISSGALIVSGGLGVAKTTYIGGIVNITPSDTTITAGTYVAVNTVATNYNPGAASSATYLALSVASRVKAGNAQNFTGVIYGIAMDARHAGSGTVSDMRAGNYLIGSTGGGILTNAYGARIGSAFLSGGGLITNNYGLYIDAQTVGGTLNYAIFTNGGLIKFGDTTDSSSISTGTLVVNGGVGIAKKLYVGDNINLTSTATLGNSLVWLTFEASGLFVRNNDLMLTTRVLHGDAFDLSGTTGILTGVGVNLSDHAQFTTGAWIGTGSGAPRFTITSSNLQIDGGVLFSNNTTDATSPTTGSISTAGGLGVVKNLYVGGAASWFGGNAVSNTTVNINGAAATLRDLRFATAGSLRWSVRTDATAESGSDVGSDFILIPRHDDGTPIGNALFITRASMAVQLGSTLGVGTTPASNAGITVSNGTIGAALYVQDAGTTNIAIALQLVHNTSGTPAAGFGLAAIQYLETTTTPSTSAGQDQIYWVDPTHASRKARRVITIYDTAAREVIRMEASGSAPMIGFLGAAAAIRQTGGAVTAGGTYTATEQGMLQKAYDALRTFGLLT